MLRNVFTFFVIKHLKIQIIKIKKIIIKNIFFQIEKKSWKLKKKIRNNKVIITNLGKIAKKAVMLVGEPS